VAWLAHDRLTDAGAFSQQEVQGLERIQPVSRCCKE
jgi:hypothetical protein